MEMDFEFYVHGVPKGQKMWRFCQEDLSYIQGFYNNTESEDVSVKFLVEVREVKGVRYCYYSYLRYNVLDCDNRSGSYMGMTIRIDKYCSDIVGIYELLDLIYSQRLLGLILNSDENKTKFLISDFQTADIGLNRIKKFVMDSFQNLFTSPISYKIDLNRFRKPEVRQLCKINLSDCSKNHVEDIIQQFWIVAISPNYSTAKEMMMSTDYNQKMKSLSDLKDGEISALNSSLAKEKSRNAELITQREELNKVNSGLERKIRYLESDVSNLKSSLTKEVSDIWKEVVRQYSYGLLDNGEVKEWNMNLKENKPSIWKRIFSVLHFVLLLGIAGLCTLLACNSLGNKTNKENYNAATSKIKLLTQENDALKEQIVSLQEVKPTISVKNFSGKGTLKKDSTYIVEVKDLKILKDGNWKVKGAKIEKEENGKCKIIVKGKKVIIEYIQKDQNDEIRIKRIIG